MRESGIVMRAPVRGRTIRVSADARTVRRAHRAPCAVDDDAATGDDDRQSLAETGAAPLASTPALCSMDEQNVLATADLTACDRDQTGVLR
jgi:hypothetical protein